MYTMTPGELIFTVIVAVQVMDYVGFVLVMAWRGGHDTV